MAGQSSGEVTSVVVLGAGFGGLELSTRLLGELGDAVEVTLIDKADAFVFGFSKLDLLFGKKTRDEIRIPYASMTHPRLRVRQETIEAIDPATRRVTTSGGTYDADVLVVALGADYNVAATPGLAEADEFYSIAGAGRLREKLPSFTSGRAVVGVCGPGFKCPPAPSEAAFLLDDYLRERGVRDACSIQLVLPFGVPIPPSPETSQAILARFAERGIEFLKDRRVSALRDGVAECTDGTSVPYDLFLGIPVHCAPEVVVRSGLTDNGWIAVNPQTLETKFPGIYAVGDVTSVGTPKAGIFAEGAARVVADRLIAKARSTSDPDGYDGKGSCYIEFGRHEVGRVDVDFFSTPGRPTGTFTPPSPMTAEEKVVFGSSRRARWFGS